MKIQHQEVAKELHARANALRRIVREQVSWHEADLAGELLEVAGCLERSAKRLERD